MSVTFGRSGTGKAVAHAKLLEAAAKEERQHRASFKMDVASGHMRMMSCHSTFAKGRRWIDILRIFQKKFRGTTSCPTPKKKKSDSSKFFQRVEKKREREPIAKKKFVVSKRQKKSDCCPFIQKQARGGGVVGPFKQKQAMGYEVPGLHTKQTRWSESRPAPKTSEHGPIAKKGV